MAELNVVGTGGTMVVGETHSVPFDSARGFDSLAWTVVPLCPFLARSHGPFLVPSDGDTDRQHAYAGPA